MKTLDHPPLPTGSERLRILTEVEEGGQDRKRSVSIVIPNFNHGYLLPKTVAAHLAQSLAPTEIIIVDDKSTDDSLEVAERLAREHAKVQVLRHAVNSGPNAGVNTGLKVASGDYVVFAAADDLVEPSFLQRSVDALERYPSAALSFLDPSRIFLRTRKIEHIPLALSKEERYFSPADFVDVSRKNSFTISSNTVVYRRWAIAAVGGFRADLEWQADWMTNLILAFRHGAVYIPEPLAHFVVNPRGYGESGVRSAAGQRRLLGQCLELLETEHPDVSWHFRSAALIPEMRARDIGWLIKTKRGRAFITPRLTRRLIIREIWTHIRPLAPTRFRRWMRRMAARR